MSEPLADWERQILDESDVRHHKWVPVEPGTVIPAGQPYRTEWNDGSADIAVERVSPYKQIVPQSPPWFVDSSWKPPLELPTEPTWGIAVFVGKHRFRVSRWHLSGSWLHKLNGAQYSRAAVADFIPLTPEQVARVEAAR